MENGTGFCRIRIKCGCLGFPYSLAFSVGSGLNVGALAFFDPGHHGSILNSGKPHLFDYFDIPGVSGKHQHTLYRKNIMTVELNKWNDDAS